MKPFPVQLGLLEEEPRLYGVSTGNGYDEPSPEQVDCKRCQGLRGDENCPECEGFGKIESNEEYDMKGLRQWNATYRRNVLAG